MGENLRKKVSKLLVDQRFTRTDRMHLRRIDSDISLWVDTGPLGSRADIAPFVGLRSESVETMRAELLARPSDPTVGTVGANVGYILGGEYRRWPPSATADQVLEVVDQALEMLRRHSSLDAFFELWRLQGADAPGWWIAAVATSLLLGRRDQAVALLSAAEMSECAHEDELCEQFRNVQRAVFRYIDEHGV